MEASRYLFQSPYANQVQIGRVDPSVKKESSTSQESAPIQNETLQKAQNFQAAQTQEVKPSVESSKSTHLLDTYV